MAEQTLAGRIHGDEPAIDACGEDAVVHALDHRGEETLAPPHLLLGQAQRVLHMLERRHQLLGLVLGDGEPVLHDHARRRRSQGRGEQPLEPDAQLEQLGDGELRGSLAAEELAHEALRFLVAHVVMHEPLDFGSGQDGRGARRLAFLPRRAHEGRGLGAVVDVLLGKEGHEHEEGDVDEE